jgi:hypothetical protein
MLTIRELAPPPISRAALEQVQRETVCNCVWFDDGCEHLITCPRHLSNLLRRAEELDALYSLCA